jgi:outer membrane biosynthesis protein TonB
MTESGEHTKHRVAAAVLALLVHGLLLLLLYLMVIRTPIPPFPESGSSGLEVNFGLDASGMGEEQTALNDAGEPAPPEEAAPAPAEEEPVITNDNGEDTPLKEVKKEKKKKKKEKQKEVAEVKKETPKETATEKPVASENKTTTPKPEPQKAVALYGGKKKNGAASDGNKGGTGDQGDPEGDPNSRTYGKRTGSGNGGDGGDGTGQGNGSGSGNQPGKPVSFSLTGRKAGSLPVPKEKFDEAGRVVVEIFVDQQGNVKRAKAGIKGSTTSNPTLLDIARKAALKSVFSVSEDAPEEQRGTIVYNFILN